MNYTVRKFDSEEWTGKLSEGAHASCFNELRPSTLESVDFALVGYCEGRPTCYIQCIEMDKETIYWQFGGAFKEFKKSIALVRGYNDAIAWCAERYKRITTRIENTNVTMLKLALSFGFIVQGIWIFKGITYLELCKEMKG